MRNNFLTVEETMLLVRYLHELRTSPLLPMGAPA
jgi:hypothetical protein